MKLAIIGTAGRHSDASKLRSDPGMYWNRMLAATEKVIELVGADTLVSGGAAWADHCAVEIFLRNPNKYKLELELPEELIPDEGDSLSYQEPSETSHGTIANRYHFSFKKTLQPVRGSSWSPFIDFRTASKSERATFRVGNGFFHRNARVAEANHVIAMTFGDGRRLKDGGTAHTMRAFLSREGHGDAYHLDMNTLKLYKGVLV